ncbi:uncharacterized protein Z519_12556 [Cladophialophora bantiana CBS 173.52]|uniref:Uncharacterized protein n=1 Tax=Cladophialophora bantiana (strain ATCC 10958 / CBS 173.52 / CDC B-1940 / NIH 8579) TaxID=1442370 RepID=A0A0D2H7B8_CLAB1|nr:uncharacterized protein Z519_12556 [Cladophialophora bantiana CBS 173.52]KIW86770.1 hypothetical protein Z519_12556 [Cladophialophora bantiana CBS 173.52]
MSNSNNLRPIVRYVTGYNEDDGTSVFQTTVDNNPPAREFPDGMKIFDCYLTQGFPVDVAAAKDIRAYEDLIQDPPGIVIPRRVRS